MANLGFIGLGIMGVPMAVNLQNGGNKLFVNDKKAPPAALTDGGAKACATGAEVAKNADIIFIMVPDTQMWKLSCSVKMVLHRVCPLARSLST